MVDASCASLTSSLAQHHSSRDSQYVNGSLVVAVPGSGSGAVSGSTSIKYGTLVPNRIFVGGISSTTTEADLHKLFSAFGNVKATKIISDRGGCSKGYGFVTFETEEEAKKLQAEVLSKCAALE
jgi:RNA recognition motif-containing protein